jgi:hypothetical protein
MIEIYDLRRLPDDGETIDEVLEKSWLAAEVGPLRASEDRQSGPPRLDSPRAGQPAWWQPCWRDRS